MNTNFGQYGQRTCASSVGTTLILLSPNYDTDVYPFQRRKAAESADHVLFQGEADQFRRACEVELFHDPGAISGCCAGADFHLLGTLLKSLSCAQHAEQVKLALRERFQTDAFAFWLAKVPQHLLGNSRRDVDASLMDGVDALDEFIDCR